MPFMVGSDDVEIKWCVNIQKENLVLGLQRQVKRHTYETPGTASDTGR